MPSTHRAQSYTASSLATKTKKTTLPIDVKRNGSQPSNKRPAEWFTGSVRVNPLFQAPVPARARGELRMSSSAKKKFDKNGRIGWF
jgi:hypothetical protein